MRRAEGIPGMTTEDLHGNERRSAPPALLPPFFIVYPDLSSFLLLKGSAMAFIILPPVPIRDRIYETVYFVGVAFP
jgi:hypothetical protein